MLNVGTGIGCIGVLGGVDQVRALGELQLAGLLQGASYIMRTSCMHVAHDHNDNGLQSYIHTMCLSYSSGEVMGHAMSS